MYISAAVAASELRRRFRYMHVAGRMVARSFAFTRLLANFMIIHEVEENYVFIPYYIARPRISYLLVSINFLFIEVSDRRLLSDHACPGRDAQRRGSGCQFNR